MRAFQVIISRCKCHKHVTQLDYNSPGGVVIIQWRPRAQQWTLKQHGVKDATITGAQAAEIFRQIDRNVAAIEAQSVILEAAKTAILDKQKYTMTTPRLPRVTAIRSRCTKCARWTPTNQLSFCTTCGGDICDTCDCGHNTWGA